VKPLKRDPLYLRNVIFGIEDSLVSTVGLLAGIASEAIPYKTILLTGSVYIVVEAFSMAVGSFLSEESAEEYVSGAEALGGRAAAGAIVMFLSFVIAGFIPIVPYLFLSGSAGLYGSIVLSLIALFILGIANGRISKIKPIRRAIRMVVMGGCAIIVGVLVGYFVKGA